MSTTREEPSRFELRRLLGEGGAGVVYEAIDRERGVRVAVKMLRTVDAANLYRFKREFRTLSGVSHPNIVALYELVCEGDRWFLSMELIEGEDLLSFVRPPGAATDEELSGVSSPFGPAEVTADTRIIIGVPEVRPEFTTLVDELRLRSCLAQLAAATRTLHESGLVHRDLKPSNTRVTTGGRLVLMDFGIAATENEPGALHGDATAGTPSYMAPEQAAGDRPTPAADWYAFGSIMYHAMTGRLPFEGPRNQVLVEKQRREPRPVSDLVEGCPPDLEELCMNLLALDPAKRPTGEMVLRKLGPTDHQRTYTTKGAHGGKFVGRDLSLARMLRIYRDVRAGQSACVLLVGDVGMGKSAFLERLTHEVAVLPEDPNQPLGGAPVVLSGRCHESESLAYRAFDDIVDGLTRHLLSLPDHAVAELLPRNADSLPRLFPVLRRIPAVRVAQPLHGLDGASPSTQAFAALRNLLTALAQRSPFVIVIDDMHWADPSSLELIEQVFHAPPIEGLCLVLSTRAATTEVISLRTALARVFPAETLTVLELGPLTLDDQRMLVAMYGAEEPNVVANDEAVWSASEGNPLFLHELVRFVSEHPARLSEWSALPAAERLNAALAARVQALADEPRRLLEAIALARHPLPIRVLARAAGIARDDAERAAAVLRVAGFARAEQGAEDRPLVVNHPRVVEIVLSQMTAAATEQLHRHLADELDRWDDAPPAALAFHLLATGDRTRGEHYLCAAAELSFEKGDTERAVELYQAALDAGGPQSSARGAIEARRAALLMDLGRAAEAAAAFGQAAIGAGRNQRAEYLQLRAENLLWSGDIIGGLAVFKDVLKLHGRDLPKTKGSAIRSLLSTRVRLWWTSPERTSRTADDVPSRVLSRIDSLHAAATALTMLDPLKGAALQREHYAVALRAGEPVRLRRALALDAVYRALREADSAHSNLADVARLVDESRVSDAPEHVATALSCRATVEGVTGDADAAIKSAAEGERILALHGRRHSWERGNLRYVRVLSLIYRGQFHDAGELVASAVEEAASRGDRVLMTTFRTIPSAFLTIGQGKGAVEELQRELATLAAGWVDDPHSLIQWRILLAELMLALALDDLPLAEAKFVQAFADARASGLVRIPWGMANVHQVGLQLAVRKADQRKFDQHAAPLLRARLPTMAAAVDAGRAAMALQAGNTTGCTRLLSVALDKAIEAGAAHAAASYRIALARLTGADDANALEQQALEWAKTEQLGDPEMLFRYLAPGLTKR